MLLLLFVCCLLSSCMAAPPIVGGAGKALSLTDVAQFVQYRNVSSLNTNDISVELWFQASSPNSDVSYTLFSYAIATIDNLYAGPNELSFHFISVLGSLLKPFSSTVKIIHIIIINLNTNEWHNR